MMFVFIQFCLHIICQRKSWCKGYEERLQILFPEIVSLTRLPRTSDIFFELVIIIFVGFSYL